MGYLVPVESIYLISNMDVFMCSPSNQKIQSNQKVGKGKGGAREGTVISTSGGRVKFISNMDVFMCSPSNCYKHNQVKV